MGKAKNVTKHLNIESIHRARCWSFLSMLQLIGKYSRLDREMTSFVAE